MERTAKKHLDLVREEVKKGIDNLQKDTESNADTFTNFANLMKSELNSIKRPVMNIRDDMKNAKRQYDDRASPRQADLEAS